MKHRRLFAKSFILTAMLVATAALYLMPTLVTAAESKAEQDTQNKALPQVTIAITSKGISAAPTSLEPGNHLLTIENSTSEPRGIEMIGIDSASSPTVRYTKILQPGQSEAFRWYFANGKTVYVRDIMSCGHDERNCMMVTFGQMRKAIDVN
jgi:hypothetical protein